MADILYSTVSKWQGEIHWGDVLDAGTGEQSLEWLLGLDTKSITAITGDPYRQSSMREKYSSQLRPQDQILAENWLNHELFLDRQFDVVVADYLLGALEGFAPYFQTELFARLKPHVRGFLYVIGLEPFSSEDRSDGAKIIREIAALRDACILLAGHKPYREYPRTWAIKQLELAGYHVERSASFPILFGHRFVHGQLDVCKRKLYFMKDSNLIKGLDQHIEALRIRASDYIERNGKINFGSDYIIKSKA